MELRRAHRQRAGGGVPAHGERGGGQRAVRDREGAALVEGRCAAVRRLALNAEHASCEDGEADVAAWTAHYLARVRGAGEPGGSGGGVEVE